MHNFPEFDVEKEMQQYREFSWIMFGFLFSGCAVLAVFLCAGLNGGVCHVMSRVDKTMFVAIYGMCLAPVGLDIAVFLTKARQSIKEYRRLFK